MAPGGLTTVFEIVVFGTFNLPIIGFLCVVPFGKLLSKALNEKSPTGESTDSTSYSRVTGALGAIVLTSFFWSIGNIVVFLSVHNRTKEISELLYSSGRFFLIGAALFLPYAFNQLKTLFPWSATAAAAMARSNVQGVLTVPVAAAMRINVTNLSADVSDEQLQRVIDAISFQVANHFAPEWQQTVLLTKSRVDLQGGQVAFDRAVDAVIYLGTKINDPDSGAQQALGYHNTNSSNVPYGFVYLDVCARSGEIWSVTLSHEVLELLVDPTAVTTVTNPATGANGNSYALEVCDPTQGDQYLINGVMVANFVTRAFFSMPGRSADMNYCGLPQKPFEPRPNGYIQYIDADGDTQQDWGDSVTTAQKEVKTAMGSFRRNARPTRMRDRRRCLGWNSEGGTG